MSRKSSKQNALIASAETMLGIGRALITLKKQQPHGSFTKAVEEEFGISPRIARIMMKATTKYLSLDPSTRFTLLALGRAKLFELMSQDVCAIKNLTNGGTLEGFTFGDIKKMTSRELKAALMRTQNNKDDDMFKTDTIFPDHPDFQPILSSLFYANANTPTDLDVLDLDTITSIYVGMTMIVAYQGANAVLFARQR